MINATDRPRTLEVLSLLLLCSGVILTPLRYHLPPDIYGNIFLLSLLFVWTLKELSIEREIELTYFHIFGILFICLALASTFWSESISRSFHFVLPWIASILFIVSIQNSINHKHQVDLLLILYLSLTLVFAAGIIYNYIVQSPWQASRYSFLGENPNRMGFFLAVGVPISLRFLHSNNRTFYTHFIFVFCAVIILISAIFLTGSRTAIVALLPSVLVVIYFSIYMYSIISKKMAFLISIASILPLFYFLPVEEIWIRISSIYSEVVNLSFGSRYVIWTEGFQVFANSPTIGVGYGGFRAAAEPILGYEVPPESTYLGALYQLGIIGAILFTLVLTSLFKMAKSNLLWLSFLITNLILMITNDWLHYPTMWILFAIMVVDLTLDNPVERTTKTQ